MDTVKERLQVEGQLAQRAGSKAELLGSSAGAV